MNLIPRPLHCQPSPGRFLLPATLSVKIDDFDPSLLAALRARLNRPIELSSNGAKLIVSADPSLAAEGYRLTVTPDLVRAEAADPAGVRYALTSLYLLIETDSLPCGCIEDAPKYGHRGLSLDCVRHFFPAAEVKKIIEQMSLVKLNVLHWHLSDDQGWRIESRRFPALHDQPGNDYYTQDEIRDVLAFAADRGIEVVPEIDLPGHTTGLLKAYPQYSCSGQTVEYARTGGVFKIILCPGKEETFAFLQELLEELIGLFPGPRFHIGGDEAPKFEWETCPHCKARMKQEGLENTEELQAYFTNRLAAFLRARGKQPICWNDSLAARRFDPASQIQFWSVQYEEFTADYMARGGQLILSDMFHLYFDYPHSMSGLQKVYEYQPLVADVNYAGHPGFLGIEAAVWAEHFSTCEELEKRLFPRLYAVAENAWSHQLDYADFQHRLPALLQLARRCGICCTSLADSDPEGEARLRETFAYMQTMHANLPKDIAQTVKPNETFSRHFATHFFRPSDRELMAKMRHNQ